MIAARASGLSFREAAKMAGCSESSARKICDVKEKRSSIEAAAVEEGKAEFIKKAWEIIGDSLSVIKTRIELAKKDGNELLDVVNDLIEADAAFDEKEKNRLAWEMEKKIKALTLPSLKDLASVVSIMYDRAEAADKKAIGEDDGIVKIDD